MYDCQSVRYSSSLVETHFGWPTKQTKQNRRETDTTGWRQSTTLAANIVFLLLMSRHYLEKKRVNLLRVSADRTLANSLGKPLPLQLTIPSSFIERSTNRSLRGLPRGARTQGSVLYSSTIVYPVITSFESRESKLEPESRDICPCSFGFVCSSLEVERGRIRN